MKTHTPVLPAYIRLMGLSTGPACVQSCLSFLSYSPPDDSALPGLCYVLGVALASLDRHIDAEQAFGDAIRLHIGK